MTRVADMQIQHSSVTDDQNYSVSSLASDAFAAELNERKKSCSASSSQSPQKYKYKYKNTQNHKHNAA
jgi:hypothetical protein